MKVKLEQVVSTLPDGRFGPNVALVKLASADLPAKTAYWLKRITKAVGSESEQVETLRNQLIEKYGTKTGDKIQVEDEESLKKFSEEMNEVLAEDIDLPGDPLALDRLGDVKLSALDLMRLDWLIIDGEGDSSTEAAKGAGA